MAEKRSSISGWDCGGGNLEPVGGAGRQCLARFGQFDRAVQQDEGGCAEMLLERFDLEAERCGRDREFLSRLGEGHVPRRRIEGAQGSQGRQAFTHVRLNIPYVKKAKVSFVRNLWSVHIAFRTGTLVKQPNRRKQ